jgi:molybdopterin-binding protein
MEVFARPSDAEVAAIVGMETVVEGVIAGSEAGLARVRIGGAELLAVTEQSAGAVLVCIRGEDVVLRRAGAARDSARNTLAARVVWLRPEGALVRVGLDCGFALTALVTRPSVEELSIAVGSGLLAAIKAPAIHLIPR